MKERIKKHRVLVIITSIVLVAGIATWFIVLNKPAQSLAKITETRARLGNVTVTVENDGIISADKAVLNFSQTGTLATLNVKVGDSVQKGDLLAALDSTKLAAQVDQAQANFNANNSKASRLAPGGEEVVAKQATVDTARIALTAEQAIYNDIVSKYGVGSSQEIAESAKMRKAEADIVSAEAQLAITKASYSDAKYAANSSYASIVAARATLYDTQVTSPISGVVTSVNGAVGQSIGGSQTTQNGFITVTNPKSIVLISQFDEEDISKISAGQSIHAKFDATGVEIDGHVVYVSPAAVVDQNGTTTYEVRTSLEVGDKKIFDGMSATVQFITKEVRDVVVVPNKAIKRVDGKSVISYYDDKRQVMTKPVLTGFTDGKSVAVTEGIKVGDAYLIIE